MKLRNLLVAAYVSAALPGGVALAAEDAAAGAAGSAGATVVDELEQITVTARRRDEELQDVPLPITVIDSKLLDETGSFNVARLQQLAPTLQFYSSNPRNSAANIRGLGAPFGLTNDGIEQGVGLYVDDVYYSRAAASTFDFLDVERVEVLRGPQGTLYGKNTTAGAINITTRAPSFTPEASAEISVGNLGFLQAKAVLSGPLGESVAARLAISSTSRHGTLLNTASTNRVNELDNLGVRGQILWRASEALDVTFSGDYNRQDAECCGSVFVRHGSTQRAANRQYPALSALQDMNPYVAGIQPYAAPSTNAFDRLTDYDAELDAYNELGGAAVHASWDLGAGSFTSVTAWRYWDWGPKNDRDFTGVQVTTKSNNPSHQDQYTQEFRYAFTGEKIDYVIGLFGYKQTVHTDGIQEQGPQASRWLINPTSSLSQDPTVLNGLTSYNNIDFQNTSAALFAQLSWKLSDKFSIEPGIRLNYDDKKGSYASTVINGAGETLPTSPQDPFYTATTPASAATAAARHRAQRDVLAPQAYEAQFDDWNVSGDLKLSYKISQDVLLYASYAKSFKTGGITLNGVPTDPVTGLPLLGTEVVRPEDINNYELGLKTQLGPKAILNFAVFRTDVDDYQATVNNGQVSVIRGYLANAEKVKIQGVEADFNYSPTSSLNFYVNGAYTDAIYDKFTGAPCPPELSGGTTTTTNPALVSPPGTPGGVSPAYCDVSGQWMPGISKWSGSWGAQYTHPTRVLGRDGEAYFGYDGSARSRWSSNPSRSAYSDVGGYGLASFRVGFRVNADWDVYGWVKNAFDKNYYELLNAATGGNTGLVVGQPADQRTFGLTVRAQF